MHAVVRFWAIEWTEEPRCCFFFLFGLQIVAGREKARKVVQILMDNPDAFYACDTEVSEIDLKVK